MRVKKIIAITAPNTQGKYYLAEEYIEMLENIGLAGVIIPYGFVDIENFSGIIFSGGGDIHPYFYNGELFRRVKNVDTARDRWEIGLVGKARGLGLPILGICRGMQLINIALAGDLMNDLPVDYLNHEQSTPRGETWHRVEIVAERWQNIFGKMMIVNSHHHQGVATLAGVLTPFALAEDGLIEGFYREEEKIYGVQFHPELIYRKNPKILAFIAEIFVDKREE